MVSWGRANSKEIDKDIYFDNALLESIAKLQFNPFGTEAGVALWETMDQGLSILICRPKTLVEVEQIREQEAAMVATTNTLVLGEVIKIAQGYCKLPQGKYSLDLGSYLAQPMLG